MAAKLRDHFKQQITSLEMVPSSGGRFEIDADGEQIYSKLETGQFPEEADIVKQIEERGTSK